MEHKIRSGYGWIRPDGSCLNVQDPSQLTPAILACCKGITQLFNVTTERDDRFYLNLFNYAYKQGYLRVSKHQRTLGVEGYNSDFIDAHLSLINQIANNIRYKGSTLLIKRFVTGDNVDIHMNPVRNQIFPKQ